MKVAILTDLEGPSGVNGRPDSVGNQMLNRATSEQALLNEVNACCEGLEAAGVDEILVLDGHGGSNSLDILKLHPRVSLMQVGNWSPVAWLDGRFDALIQLGAHAMQHTDGYMCHTFNSHSIAALYFNGELIGEIGVASLMAAYFRVPTILVSGDEAGCAEAKAFLGDEVTTVATKSSLNRYTVVNYPPQLVYERLRKASEEAIRNIGKVKCLEMPEKNEFVIRLMCPNHTWTFEKLGWERLDEVTMRTESPDFVEAYARRIGWAVGVHQQKFGITPDWRAPYNLR